MLLMRLANEGLIKVNPIKERTWPNNASLNEYRVADLTHDYKTLVLRQQTELPDVALKSHAPEKETLLLKIQYADAEIAQLLALAEGEKVVVYRKRERRADKTVKEFSRLLVFMLFLVENSQTMKRPGNLSIFRSGYSLPYAHSKVSHCLSSGRHEYMPSWRGGQKLWEKS
jgi:hypothetical protein